MGNLTAAVKRDSLCCSSLRKLVQQQVPGVHTTRFVWFAQGGRHVAVLPQLHGPSSEPLTQGLRAPLHSSLEQETKN